MRMEFKGSFLYLRPTWILEDDKIIVRKKVYYISKMKDLQIYIPPNLNFGFSPHISFIYNNDNRRTIIDFSRDNPDFSKAKEAYKYIKSNTKEGIENRRKKEEETKKRKLEQEKLKQKTILEQEKIKKYETEKEKIKEKYINIMLDRPELLQLYIQILKHKDVINGSFGEHITKYSEDDFFKTLFWDFLLGGIKKKKFDLYKSSLLMEIYKNNFKDEEKEFEIIPYEEYESRRLFNSFIFTGKVELLKTYYRKYFHIHYFHIQCEPIIKYVMLMQYSFDFSDITRKFERNKELFQIYNNMKNAQIDNEIIVDKIYSLYESLYQNSFKYALNKNDIKVIIEIENRNQMTKKYEDNDFDISSKSQLCKFVANELSDVSEEERIVGIANTLKSQKNIDKELKFDIVVNIDEILKEIEQHIQRKKKQNEISEAKKERDRLLKGDFSKEKEIEELSLSTENIRDGFEFENYVANLYKKLGYTIEQVTKKSGDQGADVIAIKDDTKYVIQAKFYNSPVGNKAVQEVVAALAMYKADKGIVITNNTFTQSAIELADANNIELVDGDKIEEYKKQILAKL